MPRQQEEKERVGIYCKRRFSFPVRGMGLDSKVWKKSSEMKRRVSGIFLIGLLLVGAGLMCYPGISQYLSGRNHSEVIREYQKITERVSELEEKQAIEEAEEYNRRLYVYFKRGKSYVRRISETESKLWKTS